MSTTTSLAQASMEDSSRKDSFMDVSVMEEQSNQISSETTPKRRRSLKKTPENLSLKVDRPKIMGDTLRRALSKFDPESTEVLGENSITVPLFTALQLPILMCLNRANSMQDMHKWYVQHEQEIANLMPNGHDLAAALSDGMPQDFFKRLLSGVHIASYEHLLWQCRQWQKQFVYQGVFEGYKADRLKFELTQDINTQLAQFDKLYRLTLNEKAVVWMQEPAEDISALIPLSLGKLLHSFDNQGIVIKSKLRQAAASTLERLFANRAHIIVDTGEDGETEMRRLALQALAEHEPYQYESTKYGLSFDLLPSNLLKQPMLRARLALSGWICNVHYADGDKIYLLWWQDEPLENLGQIAEAFYFLNKPSPCFYWTDDPKDYSRLSMSPREQRLGRNCVLLGRFIRHVLNYEQGCSALYKHLDPDCTSLSKERLQSYLNNVTDNSASLLRYLANRN